jgi:hypothetical protein
MKKITWLVDGREVPGYGVSKIGKSIEVPKHVGNDLIRQGLATDGRLSKKEKETLGGE